MSSFLASMPGNLAMRSLRNAVCFEPVSLTTLATYATIASTGLAVVGAISGAQANKASAKSARDAALRNEQILRDNSSQASREASAQEDQLRARQRVIRGNQIAGVAQSGIGFEGTGGDLIEQSDTNMALDDLSVRYEGEMKARNLNYQADSSAFDAAVANSEKDRAMTGGYMSAAGAIASGVSSYSTWQRKYGTKSIEV